MADEGRLQLVDELLRVSKEIAEAVPADAPAGLREALANAPMDLLTLQYQRLTSEIGQQLGRRQAALDRFLTVLGGATALIVAAWTAAQAVGAPLIGLYGTAGVAVLVPLFVFTATIEHQHADLRIGQHATWIARHHEPLLPESLAWDTSRRTEFPERPWLGGDGHPRLAQPKSLQVVGIRVLVAVVDGMAVMLGASSVIASGVVGPWWTGLLTVPGVALLASATWLAVVTVQMTLHDRDKSRGSGV